MRSRSVREYKHVWFFAAVFGLERVRVRAAAVWCGAGAGEASTRETHAGDDGH